MRLTLHVQLHLGLAGAHVETIIPSRLAAVGPTHVAAHVLQPQLPVRGLLQWQPRGQQRSLLVHAGPEHRRPWLASNLALQLSGRALPHCDHGPSLGHADGGRHCGGEAGRSRVRAPASLCFWASAFLPLGLSLSSPSQMSQRSLSISKTQHTAPSSLHLRVSQLRKILKPIPSFPLAQQKGVFHLLNSSTH